MNLFGMVTTSASRDYTPLALRTFFAHTPLEGRDRVVLIDNDGDFEVPPDVPIERLVVVRPSSPQGFAANGNLLLAEARAMGADLFFLNNDLAFTPGWLAPMLADRRALLSPLSNAQVAGTSGVFTTQPVMNLADYAGHEAAVADIAAQVRASADGYRATPSVAFFCIKIPRAVYERVGDFDESFGRGGGEDRDYAIRAWLEGIPQEYALQSYVLHFQGRSTWTGSETADERARREAHFAQRFQQKWGAALTYAFIGGDWNLFRSDATAAKLLDRGDYPVLIRRLRDRPSLDRLIARQQRARIAAVCCIYDDDSWLPAAIESVYAACDSIWFLVSERPWNGEATDQAALLGRIRALPDPAGKFRIRRGQWPDEATQRNAGLRFLAEADADYCFVLDADEVYDPAQLEAALALVRSNPQVDCWRASCLTYWKSYRHRVDPPEAITAAVLVRVGTGTFVENRTYACGQECTLPPETLLFHHMSYARSDEQIRRKITTFGHAHQVVPGWFDDVWLKWDANPSMENLNPCWPSAYRRTVPQRYEALPPAVRRIWDADDQEQGPTLVSEVSVSRPLPVSV